MIATKGTQAREVATIGAEVMEFVEEEGAKAEVVPIRALVGMQEADTDRPIREELQTVEEAQEEV